MDMRRLFLFLIFSFSLIVLWGEWTRQNQPSVSAATVAKDSVAPHPATVAPIQQAASTAPAETQKVPIGKKIPVTTDTFAVEISTAGGNIERLDLLQHHKANDQSKPIILLQRQGQQAYLAQSGLLGKGLPTHNAEFSASAEEYKLADGKNDVEVRLTAIGIEGAQVIKVYTFHRASYLVDVAYEIENKGTSMLTSSAYFQLIRDSSTPEGASSFVPTYTGGAVYTDQEKFQKVVFADIEKNKVTLPKNPDNGWVGMLQHYFVSAWIPQGKSPREFYAKHLDGNLFSVGVILPVASIEPNQSVRISTPLYLGPAQTKLDEIAPGLGLTVDYGIFTIFATPLFWLMSFLNDWVHNWGVAIILLTVLIKLAFFPLSATSYRSMAKMRVVAPKLEKIKQQYGEDRERLNRAMMDLYKTEKINPLGGCLPV